MSKMKPAQRREWLLQYLLSKQAAFSSTVKFSINVLDAHLVDQYAQATGAPVKIMLIGADKSSTLGSDLAALYADGMLKRGIAGVPAVTAGGGWPKWVYSYSLASFEAAAARYNTTFDHIRETIKATGRVFDFNSVLTTA
jgi:hypothetical protein